MVNRGCTSQAEALDKVRDAATSTSGDGDVEDQDTTDMSTMMSALKFGFSSLFSSDQGEGREEELISDAQVDAIIDRTRGFGLVDPPPLSISNSLHENQQHSLSSFQDHLAIPLVDLRYIGGEYVERGNSTRPSTDDHSSLPEMTRQVSSASDSELTLRGIAAEWEGMKRDRKQRTEIVRVKNVGEVRVLKINNYTLLGGEPSVFDREIRGRVPEGWGKEPKKGKARLSIWF
jgi:hypothetical protein